MAILVPAPGTLVMVHEQKSHPMPVPPNSVGKVIEIYESRLIPGCTFAMRVLLNSGQVVTLFGPNHDVWEVFA